MAEDEKGADSEQNSEGKDLGASGKSVDKLTFPESGMERTDPTMTPVFWPSLGAGGLTSVGVGVGVLGMTTIAPRRVDSASEALVEVLGADSKVATTSKVLLMPLDSDSDGTTQVALAVSSAQVKDASDSVELEKEAIEAVGGISALLYKGSIAAKLGVQGHRRPRPSFYQNAPKAPNLNFETAMQRQTVLEGRFRRAGVSGRV